MESKPCFLVLSLNRYPTPEPSHPEAAAAAILQEPPPNDREFPFTPLPSPTHSSIPSTINLFTVSPGIMDYLRPKNHHKVLDNSAELTVAALSLSLSLPKTRKRRRSESKKTENHSSHQEKEVVKKRKAVAEEDKTLTGKHWLRKRMSSSDVNDSSRLLLPKDFIRKSVLPFMDEERCAACQSVDGLKVKIWDLDTCSEHALTFKQWKTGSFLLTSNWKVEFVNRRSLQEEDCIELFWDFENLRFLFRKFN